MSMQRVVDELVQMGFKSSSDSPLGRHLMQCVVGPWTLLLNLPDRYGQGVHENAAFVRLWFTTIRGETLSFPQRKVEPMMMPADMTAVIRALRTL